MKPIQLIKFIGLFLLLSSCGDENEIQLIDFTASFDNTSYSFSEEESEKELIISFSRTTTEAGNIIIEYTLNNAVYGVDFTTIPSGESGKITIPVTTGEDNISITVNKLTNPIEGTTRSIDFSISSFDQEDWLNGIIENTSLSFIPVASKGQVIDLLTGGSTQPYQSFIDLSTGNQTKVKRDTWEIAFYNGDENKVFLNSSLLVSAAKIDGVTDLLAVTETTTLAESLTLNSFGEPVTVTTVSELLEGLPVSYSQYSNYDEGLIFTDLQEGNLEDTAFSNISTIDSENYVYIVSLGNEIPTEAAEAGSINTTGDHRGFMKVRVLTNGESYTIQYANLAETTNYQETTILKDNSKLFSAFSLTNETEVIVEPETNDWDLNFSGVFSFNADGFGLTYSDYAIHNTLGGVGLYQVTLYEIDENDVQTTFDVPSYSNFSLEDVNETDLVYDDRTIIGSDWRSFSQGIAKNDRYYIIKDADRNFYKLRFTALLSAEGERGHSQFEYSKLE